jgi:hypothetical protein
VQEGGERPILVEAMFDGEIGHVDAAQIAVGALANRTLDGGNAIAIGRLPQHTEKSFALAHRSRSSISAQSKMVVPEVGRKCRARQGASP